MVGGEDWYRNGLMRYQELGVYAINGPIWDESSLDTICDKLGTLYCMEAKTYTLEAVSVKSKEHYIQNAIEGRFQEYADDYL